MTTVFTLKEVMEALTAKYPERFRNLPYHVDVEAMVHPLTKTLHVTVTPAKEDG